MIHARKDYNRVQDPALNDPTLLGVGSTPIGEDEPVCLFRAQDKHFVDVLKSYREMINTDMTMSNDKAMAIIRSVDAHVALAERWQSDHGAIVTPF